jgi:hypothetical protein
MVKAAAELCPELPAIGEQCHCLMTGFFDLSQVVCDIARRTAPRAIRIATLAWNKRNVIDMGGLLEQRQGTGEPLRLSLLASDFFRKQNKELVEWSREQFALFRVELAFARNHARWSASTLARATGSCLRARRTCGPTTTPSN